MASFHQSFQIIKRSAGRSAVACAAYRAGARLTDERLGNVHDFTRRQGVVHTEIMAPEGAPEWVHDRSRLWNQVEAREGRKDAQLAREINMALPCELTGEARLTLVRDYVRSAFVSVGMIADIAIHEPVPERGDDNRNVHAHIMLTMRKIGAEGFHRTKTRAWNADDQLVAWRASWAAFQNRALERDGHRARVDHRSLEAQRVAARGRGDHTEVARLDRAPEIHIGPQARASSRRQHPAESRERKTGFRMQPRRSTREAPRPARVERTVRYPEIDRGRRTDWNAGIVAGNQAHAFVRAEHRERQAVRLRQKEMRALRSAREAEQQLATWQPAKPSLFGRSRVQEAEAEHQAWEHQRRRALHRAKVARALLGDVEKILVNLLHMRGLHQQRHRALVHAMLPVIGRSGGRGRGFEEGIGGR